jgi:ribosomal protein S21
LFVGVEPLDTKLHKCLSQSVLRYFWKIKAGILAEVRAREFYEKPTTIRKREKATLAKRHAKRNARENARNTRLY